MPRKLSASALFYRRNPKSREDKKKDDAKINKRPDQVAKRVALNAFNRNQTKLGNNRKGDKKDASHKGSRIVGYSHQSKNRADKNNSAGDAKSRGGGKRRK